MKLSRVRARLRRLHTTTDDCIDEHDKQNEERKRLYIHVTRSIVDSSSNVVSTTQYIQERYGADEIHDSKDQRSTLPTLAEHDACCGKKDRRPVKKKEPHVFLRPSKQGMAKCCEKGCLTGNDQCPHQRLAQL